ARAIAARVAPDDLDAHAIAVQRRARHAFRDEEVAREAGARGPFDLHEAEACTGSRVAALERRPGGARGRAATALLAVVAVVAPRARVAIGACSLAPAAQVPIATFGALATLGGLVPVTAAGAMGAVALVPAVSPLADVRDSTPVVAPAAGV